MAIDWLEWEAKNTGQHIRHQGNDSEKLIGMKRVPVDGFCRDTNTVYEFQGCIWHGHRCWMTKKHNGVNPVNGKSLDDLYQRTQDKIQYIKDQGYNVVEMWECQWLASIKRDPELSRFIENRKRPCDGLVTMTEDQILSTVMDEKLFGALEVDIKVPDDLKSKFVEMPPIFKNIEVSRDDIGDHMKTYAEERNVMNEPRKSLIGSMYGEKIMVISPLLKWYVEHGFKVTQIHQVVEYTPATCFQKFGEQVSEARRPGDADPEKKIVAETRKLDGNSSYGKTFTTKERHTDVIYYQEYQVSRYLDDPSFRRCNQLSAKTFEVEMSKKTIRLDLPMQIGCFVYQYAKLRMLEFYYDFMDVFVDRSDLQYWAMCTDSAYMALSATSDQTRYAAAFPDGKEEFVSTYSHPRTCRLRQEYAWFV
jgi:G:T-mismatch repair DNA endonuclease (very short patch repair protein)